MIPAKIQDVFIELTTSNTGVVLEISSGKFLIDEFVINETIYTICPFLEGTLLALEENTPFVLQSMLITNGLEEYNVDVELFRDKNDIKVLLHNRTNVYKYVSQLNQNRNDAILVKKEIENKNIELEKLRIIADKANEQKSRFLAMMSHEVRNPLNVILGYSEMISDEDINDSVKEYAKLLALSGKHLKVIVNDILDLSRIEAGKLELVNSPINIKDIVENCIENFRHQNKNTQVILVLNISEDIPNLILGDNVRIIQILSNLISNALKFTEVGKISVDIKLISEDNDAVKLSLKVSDSGRGMSKEQALKIFKEFEQNQKSDHRVFGGAGLGLSIVKRLLNAMNGIVSVESQINKGTVFNLEIPFLKVNLAKRKAEIAESLSPRKLQGKRILIADDDILNQTIVKHILKKEKVVLTLVKDGLEALAMLRSKEFDIVLLDINMPNISGVDVIKQKGNYKKENKKIPVLALTANITKVDLELYNTIGFKDVIGKPYTAIEFLTKIDMALK